MYIVVEVIDAAGQNGVDGHVHLVVKKDSCDVNLRCFTH